jgi:hypothetical protein
MVDTVRVAGRIRWRRVGLVAAVVALGVLMSACASTGYNYVKDSGDKTYFKIPDGWRLFSHEDILNKAKLSDRQRQSELDSSWRVIFDSSPKPSLGHLFDTKVEHPTGMALVSQLSFNDSDTVSLSALRNLFFDLDTALQNNTADLITYEPINMDGGFHGIHIVATIDDNKGRALTFNEKAVLDQDTSKLYVVVVSCEARCYDDNETTINRVVDSWTVKN